jgi:hypothetical protein
MTFAEAYRPLFFNCIFLTRIFLVFIIKSHEIGVMSSDVEYNDFIYKHIFSKLFINIK